MITPDLIARLRFLLAKANAEIAELNDTERGFDNAREHAWAYSELLDLLLRPKGAPVVAELLDAKERVWRLEALAPAKVLEKFEREVPQPAPAESRP
jgi:hypothetical protein